jgi:hypothetical protein
MTKSYQGVIAAGKDKDTAISNYRNALMGRNIVSLASDKLSFIASDDFHTMFNPTNGELDLEVAPIDKDLEFKSENSADFGQANWMICADGCGSHIVFENEKTEMKFCPICASALGEPEVAADANAIADEIQTETVEVADANKTESEEDESIADAAAGAEIVDLTDEEDLSEESDEDDEENVPEDEEDEDSSEDNTSDEDESSESSLSGIVVASASKEKALALYKNAVAGKGLKAVVSESGASFLTSVSADISFDPTDGESLVKEVKTFELNDEEKATLSSDEAHYQVCSATSGCGSHVVSSLSVSNCPVCSGTLADPVSESEEDEESMEEDDSVEDESTEEVAEPSDEVTMNLLEDAADTDSLSVSWSPNFVEGKDAWLASLNGMPVAYATRENSGKNLDIFNDTAFGRAVCAQAKSGSKAALAEFGFKAFVVKASVKQKVQSQVDSQVAETRTALSEENKMYQARFLAALSTAAVGINRGFFAGLNNPVKQQLWESLNAVGIQDAEVLIDNVLSTSSDLYHKVLFDKAQEILSKSAEVQDELAQTVLGTNYQKAVSNSSAVAPQTPGQLGTSVANKSVSTDRPENTRVAALLQNIKFGKK